MQNEIDLFKLLPWQFQILLYRFLQYDSSERFSGYKLGAGIDEEIGFEVKPQSSDDYFKAILKYRYEFHLQEFFDHYKRVEKRNGKFNFILFTTAKLDSKAISQISNFAKQKDIEFYIYSYDDIYTFVQENKKELISEFPRIYSKSSKVLWLNIILIAILGSLLSYGVNSYINRDKTATNESTYESEIELIDNSINSLRNLEKYLEEKRSLVIQYEEVSDSLKNELEHTESILDLKEMQVNAIVNKLNNQSKTFYIVSLLISFIIGVLASLVANEISMRFKSRKELEKND